MPRTPRVSRATLTDLLRLRKSTANNIARSPLNARRLRALILILQYLNHPLRSSKHTRKARSHV